MREQILHMLVEAAEMEHNLLCTYLYAAFSLRKAGEGLTDGEADAVARWRKVIVGVAVEEMGHLATVNNLIVALGGAPHFDRPNFPVSPGYHPPGFEVRLMPFDEPTLEHFVFLERPGDADLADPDEYRSDDKPPRELGRPTLTPSARDYATIAELYAAIRRDLKLFGARAGAGTFVCTERQVSAEHTGIQGVVIIHDLATAFAALKHIVDQGEGGAHDAADSHFVRYCAIRDEWRRLKSANPRFEPAHPAARDPVMRRPAPGAERVWITSDEAAEMLDLGNALYGALLTLLTQLYQPVDDATRKRLADAAIGVMHGLSRAGTALARLPASADQSGVNAGLTFTVPRAQGERAAGPLLERVGELAAAYEKIFRTGDNPLREAGKALAP